MNVRDNTILRTVPPSDPGECRDTSVDRTLDAQLQQAQCEERGTNLLAEEGQGEAAVKSP